jgi:alpha-beta hydrolase superfamily lysophospholipase
LLAPPGDDPHSIALILAGSGPTDRNGNQPTAHTDKLKQLAHGLFAAGIATLRVDKRGIAASAPALSSEAELNFSQYVADAKAWLQMLRRQDRFERIFIVGHSEGALVATLAAQQEQPSGIILIAGIGFPLAVTIRRQLTSISLPDVLKTKAMEILASLERGELVSDVPPELNALFRASAQPYLISSLTLDPAAELAKANVPALVVQGTTDLQVTVEDAKKLAASRDGVELVVIEGMNHTLKAAPPDRNQQTSTYIDPDIPLVPELAPRIADFIRRNEN